MPEDCFAVWLVNPLPPEGPLLVRDLANWAEDLAITLAQYQAQTEECAKLNDQRSPGG